MSWGEPAAVVTEIVCPYVPYTSNMYVDLRPLTSSYVLRGGCNLLCVGVHVLSYVHAYSMGVHGTYVHVHACASLQCGGFDCD